MSLQNLTSFDYDQILSDGQLTKAKFQRLIDQLVVFTDVLEGSGAPAITAKKHQWYFDTATSKYYRNTDGGSTWVALN